MTKWSTMAMVMLGFRKLTHSLGPVSSVWAMQRHTQQQQDGCYAASLGMHPVAYDA